MALTTDLSLRLVASLTGTADLVTPSAPLDYPKRVQLTSGFAVGQADRMFSDTRSVALSSSEDLDLVGTLVDQLGGTFQLVSSSYSFRPLLGIQTM